ncbi:MAG: molybdopterin converting factor subunit 1 [Planctomycetes bacterium]|nr:molybdopterin converting factor subunit 1 [Planctomycetota bacterium]
MPSIRVKLFAAVRERLAAEEIALDVAPGTTAAELLALLAREHPRAAPLLAAVRVAANQEFVPGAYVLRETDELALIPPVSGG